MGLCVGVNMWSACVSEKATTITTVNLVVHCVMSLYKYPSGASCKPSGVIPLKKSPRENADRCAILQNFILLFCLKCLISLFTLKILTTVPIITILNENLLAVHGLKQVSSTQ